MTIFKKLNIAEILRKFLKYFKMRNFHGKLGEDSELFSENNFKEV